MPTRTATPLTTGLLLTLCAALVVAGLALAQDGDAPALGVTPLAQSTLSSVVDTPLHLRLVQITVQGGETARFTADEGMVYQLSGTQTITVGERTETLSPGQGTYVDGGVPATFEAAAGDGSVFLHFLLVPTADADLAQEASAPEMIELFYSPQPLPGLVDGAYTFDLTHLEFPARYPINDPHYRTGAALYYVLSGSGEFTAEGVTEPKPTGSAILEPQGLVHQWANPHEDVTAVVVANISPEGGAAIEFGAP